MFCLRKEFADTLRGKIKSGEITPQALSDMSSAQRLGYFSSFMDVDTAQQTNALIEGKLLLKNQEQGLINAVQQILGQKSPSMRDVLSRINKIQDLLTPTDKEKFMGDIVAKKLGLKGEVSPDEAKEISRLANLANKAKSEVNPKDIDSRIKFGRARQSLTDYVDSLKPQGNPFLSFSNWWNLPKSALTSILHFSAPIVQGWGLTSTRAFWKALPRMFTYYTKENYDNLNAFITTHPDYKIAVAAKLGLTKVSDKLNSREESIQSSILEHVPVLKNIVKGSSRAFTGFLNDARFGRYVDLLNAARLHGEDVSVGKQITKDLANVVNDFSGRANLGENDEFANAQVVLNNVFFAPRKMMATINMFNPERYLNPNISAIARQAAIKQLLGSMIVSYSMLQLAHLAGAKVDFDPRSQNFGKFKFGKTTFDITGGNSIYLRMLTRAFSGTTKTSYGEVRNLKASERTDQVMEYFKNKLAPMNSYIWDYISHAIAGKPFNAAKEAINEMTPIFIGDMINLVRYDTQNTAAYLASPLAMLGASMQTEEPGSAWENSTSKVLGEFKQKVGEENFDKANEEFDNKFDEWMKKTQGNQDFKSLSADEKESVIKSERTRIEKQVLKDHGFVYKEKRKRFSALEFEND